MHYIADWAICTTQKGDMGKPDKLPGVVSLALIQCEDKSTCSAGFDESKLSFLICTLFLWHAVIMLAITFACPVLAISGGCDALHSCKQQSIIIFLLCSWILLGVLQLPTLRVALGRCGWSTPLQISASSHREGNRSCHTAAGKQPLADCKALYCRQSNNSRPTIPGGYKF